MVCDLLKQEIVILDGATGTLIQQYGLEESDYRADLFQNHSVPLKGNNDILSLTQPEIIKAIHKKYVDAGADIIETNTFNSNAVSQEEYHCADLVYTLNKTGAQLAREEVAKADRPVFVAGSIGPTSKTLSLSPDALHPEYRAINFDSLSAAYQEQVRGLIDGGADLLLVETIFDGLNAKAALNAITLVQKEKNTDLPVMMSVTISSKGGRLLTGQSLEAFFAAIAHYPLLSFGLNCSFGASDLYPCIERLSAFLPCYLSIYPNAGLPNATGEYDETPQLTANYLKKMATSGLLNLAGGCCGTTPAHIQAIREALKDIPPRKIPLKNKKSVFSGLETVKIDKNSNFTLVGERTNVAGSAKFARLVREQKLEEAATIARKQIETGASIIDINMDDAMLESAKEMETFTRYISNDPDIAKVPLMIDSSDWNTILVGLKNAQGKSIVNSISLKEGEAEFLRKAIEIRNLGGAVVVMAFDEKGQAVNYQQKIDICKRAYTLLTEKANYPPQNIIFDVNVLSIGTGLEEHDNYAVDFINAVHWIKNNLSGCLTSGGISNLSFAFRGNNMVREAMHSVFLYHAIKAGLDMAIVNPAALQHYDDIEPELLENVENVILNTSHKATEELIAYAEKIKNIQTDSKNDKSEIWRETSLKQRLEQALVKGITDFLKEDLAEAISVYDTPVAIIEGPFMQGMERVGELFGEGKLFLPQVVKSARVMREAVALLQPEIEKIKNLEAVVKRPKMLLATVKGDVHDIGKNIVSIVLSCNNIEVVDLGVMVDNHTIIQAVKEQQPDFIGVSGLITPSLKEMEALCILLQKEQLDIPLLIGGATTSSVHTAVKLAPLHDYGVIQGGDASKSAIIIKRLLQDEQGFIEEVKEKQKQIRTQYAQRNRQLISYSEAQQKVPAFSRESYLQSDVFGIKNVEINNLDINELIPFIDWTPFFHFWGFKGKCLDLIQSNVEAQKLHQSALEILSEIIAGNEFEASIVLNFYNAYSEEEVIVLDGKYRLPMLRQQKEGTVCLSLADFFPKKSSRQTSKVGLFTLKVSDKKDFSDKRDFQYLLRSSLCARLAEALAEWMQAQYENGDKIIRPAFGYPACPDHSIKKDVFDLLKAEEKIDIHLLPSFAISPSTSLCGMMIAHPEAHYFGINAIGDDQFTTYFTHRAITEKESEKLIGHLLTDKQQN
ncbi:MAG: methionine synthase [Bacteroidales bacterium]|jgi:5-methyltetrahydrofolate--homocysteine methyltransferase|nr:methionine synthase [Bacteroidales bacterium]